MPEGAALSNKIRLHYTGLSIFFSKVFSVLTGFIFVLMITRQLAEYDFGVWQNIGDVIVYLTLFSTVLPPWVLRYVSRGYDGAPMTGFVTNLAMAIPFTIACAALSPFFGKIAGTNPAYFVLASVQVFQLHLIPLLEHVTTSKKPHLLAYDIVLHEILKIAVGMLLVVYLKMGLVGAILSVIAANTADICLFLAILGSEFHARPRWDYLKPWFKTSTLSIYSMIGGRIVSLDMMLLILFGGALVRALYGAAYTITILITYTGTLAYGLYPRLLSGGGGADVEASIKLTTIFAVPSLIGVITIAHPLLVILNPSYESAYPILYILSIVAFLGCYSSIFDSVITGTEKVDTRPEFTIKDLARSRLFILPTLGYVQAVLGLPILYLIFDRVTHADLHIGLLCAAMHLSFGIAFAAARFKISRRCLRFHFPLRTFLTSLAASAAMSAFLIFAKIPGRISYVFLFITLGGAIYFTVVTIIDSETRMLVFRIATNFRRLLSRSDGINVQSNSHHRNKR